MIKDIFDTWMKERNFMTRDLIQKWDSSREAKGKHGKFDNLWLRTFKVFAVQDNNTYELAHIDGEIFGAPMNQRFLKKFI
jgi:hypothetical protein